jgi:nucleoside-triphosphatase THEP1
VLERVVEHLGDLRVAGFLTLELREHGQRVGFEAVGLGGGRAILAHVRFRPPVSVGRYGVEPDRLIPLIGEEKVRPPLENNKTQKCSHILLTSGVVKR